MAAWLIEAIQARLAEKTMWPMHCLSFFDPLIAGQSAPSWLPLQGHITVGRRRNAVADWAKAWAQSVAAPSGVELDAAQLGCNTGVLLVPKLRLTAWEVLMRNLRIWLHRRVALQSQNQSNLPMTARILQKKGALSTMKL